MKRTLVYTPLLTGLCLVLAGCGTVARNLNIVNPSYSIRDVRPRVAIALPLSSSTIDFDFVLGVDNPNAVGVKLSRIDFDVLVNDNPVVSSVSNERINIPARGMGELRLHSRVGYDNLRSLWREVADAIQGNRARYAIRGNAYYDTPNGQLRFPVTVYTTR